MQSCAKLSTSFYPNDRLEQVIKVAYYCRCHLSIKTLSSLSFPSPQLWSFSKNSVSPSKKYQCYLEYRPYISSLIFLFSITNGCIKMSRIVYSLGSIQTTVASVLQGAAYVDCKVHILVLTAGTVSVCFSLSISTAIGHTKIGDFCMTGQYKIQLKQRFSFTSIYVMFFLQILGITFQRNDLCVYRKRIGKIIFIFK